MLLQKLLGLGSEHLAYVVACDLQQAVKSRKATPGSGEVASLCVQSAEADRGNFVPALPRLFQGTAGELLAFYIFPMFPIFPVKSSKLSSKRVP